MSHRTHLTLAAALTVAAIGCACSAPAWAQTQAAYVAIQPRAGEKVITLTGHDLSIDEVVRVARYGAPVQLSSEARQRSADAYGLLLEAAAEGIPVYWFNRGAGAQRETEIFSGDPLSAENSAKLSQRQLGIFRRGATIGLGPEVSQEEIVRAMLVVRANAMSYEAASPQLTQMLLDLLNHRITPVVWSRTTVGEGDLVPLMNVGATMVGAGEAYYQGVRMPAADALRKAGLKPLAPFAADDSELTSSNAYATGQAALLVDDARHVLEWGDLTYAIDLDGMNSSITPLSSVVQRNRPFKWLNWHAARTLDMLKGSYLFEEDPHRIIQDPESLRASSIRQASAWQAWGTLRDDVLIQMNSSDHNPAVRVGMSPSDSWELDTPQLRKFFVKGGPHSGGKHGYIVSDANWDPYPMSNDIEAFTIALANADVTVAQRTDRFTNTFFTVVRPADVLPPGSETAPGGFAGFAAAALFQEIQSLAVPVNPEGNAIVQTVEDLQAQSRLKVVHARQAVADTLELLADDLLTGTFWMDVRKVQNGGRNFGPAPTAAWQAFRKVVPFQPGSGPAPQVPIHELTVSYMRSTPVSLFYGDAGKLPAQ
ncbi:MAG TPA: aromatic amino acid ammonia-lyase [Steroidobacteraceae bacterium]|nr:aromatic amino acid ammonia-lyase [Steroidobacteraceae bacterium]